MSFLLPPRGLDPLDVSPKDDPAKDVTSTSQNSLAHETQIEPDLARILQAWPTLPDSTGHARLDWEGVIPTTCGRID
jgi:hypothetical protein